MRRGGEVRNVRGLRGELFDPDCHRHAVRDAIAIAGILVGGMYAATFILVALYKAGLFVPW